MRLSDLRRTTATAAAVAVLVLATAAAPVARAVANAVSPKATPVIMVHGYSTAACPGTDVTKGIWGGAYLKLSEAGWTGSLLPVSFYKCDTDGVDITGYGPSVPTGATPTVTADRPRVPYTQDTELEQLAHDLAWFVYDTFASTGTPVDLVGHSMGGLIVRYALYRVAAGDPQFPPYLYVPRVLTFATPHAGYLTLAANADFCGGHLQCDEMAGDGPFMADLMAHAAFPQGSDGTAWTLIGSRDCDTVPVSSALAMPAATRVDYRDPCYAHDAFLWDFESATDATAQVRAPGAATATTTTTLPRSLRLVVRTMANPPVFAAPDVAAESVGHVDITPPTVTLSTGGGRFVASQSITLRMRANDTDSGVANFAVRYRVAAWDGSFGDYRYPFSWQERTRASLTMTGRPGHEYCFSVRARDHAENVSGWTGDQCVVVPVDDRSLVAVAGDWHRSTSSAAYRQTVTRTSERGALLGLGRVHGNRLALIVTECSRCGTIAIYLDGSRWRSVDTYAATTRPRRILVQPGFSLRTVTVTLRDADGRRVVLDGFGVASD